MRRLLSSSLALLLGLCLPAAAAEFVLRHDEVAPGRCEVDFTHQLAAGEAVGESFEVPPSYPPYRLIGVELLVGPGGLADLTIALHEDSGAAAPGTLLAQVKAPAIAGSPSTLQRLLLAAPVTSSAKRLRAVVSPAQASRPGGLSVAIDPLVAATASTVCSGLTPPCRWGTAAERGVRGAFVVRVIGAKDGLAHGPPQDAGSAVDCGQLVPDGGVSYPEPRLDSISPSTVKKGQGGPAVVLGRGFAAGAMVHLEKDGRRFPLGAVTVENPFLLRGELPPGLDGGTYDLVIELTDGRSGRLAAAFEVTSGGRGPLGVGCAVGPRGSVMPWALSLLLVAGLVRQRRQRRRR